jgi:hypothetical protein
MPPNAQIFPPERVFLLGVRRRGALPPAVPDDVVAPKSLDIK